MSKAPAGERFLEALKNTEPEPVFFEDMPPEPDEPSDEPSDVTTWEPWDLHPLRRMRPGLNSRATTQTRCRRRCRHVVPVRHSEQTCTGRMGRRTATARTGASRARRRERSNVLTR